MPGAATPSLPRVPAQPVVPTPGTRTPLAPRAGREPPALLPAALPIYDGTGRSVLLAELLLLDPAGVDLQEMMP